MRKFVVFLVLFSMISISIFQFGSTNAIALEENKRDYSQMDERLVPYQMIVDEINEEYGMSIESCESYVERKGYEKLLSISLEDYKNTLLKDVEFVKKMQKEYEEAIAKVPSDAVWYKCSPREGYLETIKDYLN